MIPTTWIFVALCLAPYVTCLQTDGAACDVATSEYDELVNSFRRALTNFTTAFESTPSSSLIPSAVPSTDPAKAQIDIAVDDLRKQLNLSAQAVEKVISHCSQTPEQCRKDRGLPITAELLMVCGKLLANVQAEEYAQHVQTLRTCWKQLLVAHRSLLPTEAQNEERRHVYRETASEMHASCDDTSVPCGFVCGRKSACRMVQIAVPMGTGQPGAHVREVCGHNVEDLVVELQKQVMDALNCSEFGDYVREWGWVKVNYRANQTASALHR